MRPALRLHSGKVRRSVTRGCQESGDLAGRACDHSMTGGLGTRENGYEMSKMGDRYSEPTYFLVEIGKEDSAVLAEAFN